LGHKIFQFFFNLVLYRTGNACVYIPAWAILYPPDHCLYSIGI